MKKKYPESDYPIYEIVVDDNSVAGIRLLSIVEDPAIEMKGVFFSVEKSTKNYEFKAQEDKQIIVGPAMIPGLKILRIDDDGNKYYNIFSPETIMKLVQKFNSVGSNRRINVDHSKRMVNAYIMENWIVEDEFYDKSRKYGFDVPVGTWMVTIKIEDKDFWMNEVKELGKFGFSIEGTMGQRALNYESIEDHIDNLTDDEILIMMASKYDIPQHPNCKCYIYMGEWILGDSKSGNCEKCINAAKDYNS
jgi:hypothetical protein